jgi:hypothetical protein
MTSASSKPPADPIRTLRGLLSLGALLIALAHLLWPSLAIDAVTLVLVMIALVPWLAPIFKSLEFPGGWKVEFQDLQKAAAKAEAAGLLATTPAAAAATFTFQRVAEEDPNLALAGLRIEIEKRLVSLAAKRGIDSRNRGVGYLLRLLGENGALQQQERSALADLTGLLNSAVHGARVDQDAARWAIEIGPRLLKALDDLATAAQQGHGADERRSGARG